MSAAIEPSGLPAFKLGGDIEYLAAAAESRRRHREIEGVFGLE